MKTVIEDGCPCALQTGTQMLEEQQEPHQDTTPGGASNKAIDSVMHSPTYSLLREGRSSSQASRHGIGVDVRSCHGQKASNAEAAALRSREYDDSREHQYILQ